MAVGSSQCEVVQAQLHGPGGELHLAHGQRPAQGLAALFFNQLLGGPGEAQPGEQPQRHDRSRTPPQPAPQRGTAPKLQLHAYAPSPCAWNLSCSPCLHQKLPALDSERVQKHESPDASYAGVRASRQAQRPVPLEHQGEDRPRMPGSNDCFHGAFLPLHLPLAPSWSMAIGFRGFWRCLRVADDSNVITAIGEINRF